MDSQRVTTSTPPVSREPLLIKRVHCGAKYDAFIWTVADEQLLAQYLAFIAAGHYGRVALILSEADTSLDPFKKTSVTETAARLFEPPSSQPLRWHRDGLVFQLIAWIAAWQQASPNDRIRTPHLIRAHKGFDGLLVRVGDGSPGVEGVTICEQKASEDPRKKIREEVWPSLKSIERGDRDPELLQEVTGLLSHLPLEEAYRLAQEINWKGQRWYRVAVTTDKTGDAATYDQLFDGFEEAVQGESRRRQAEAMNPPGELREWMDQLCRAVCVQLEQL